MRGRRSQAAPAPLCLRERWHTAQPSVPGSAPDEAGTIARLKALRKEFIEPMVAEYRGRFVKLMGDGALVEFASAVEAVECAVAIPVREHGWT